MIQKSKTAWRWTATADAAALLWSEQQLRRRTQHQGGSASPGHCRRDGLAVGRRASDYTSSYEQLRDLSAALQLTREEERAHIARELHDDLGQLLATLRVDLSLLLQQPLPTPQAERQLRSMDELLQQAFATLRRIATDLRPAALDGGGLYFALQTLQDEWGRRHGIAYHLDAREDELILDDRYSTAVFRIVQESLTNIARHAGATEVLISVRKRRQTLRLYVEDNGSGIAPADLTKPHSFGLIGMRERVWALNGDIAIGSLADSTDGHGTRIAIELPLPAAAADAKASAVG